MYSFGRITKYLYSCLFAVIHSLCFVDLSIYVLMHLRFDALIIYISIYMCLFTYLFINFVIHLLIH